MVLLAAEQGLAAAEIAPIVRQDEGTVRRCSARYLAEGTGGLSDAPRSGAPARATSAYRERLLARARRRPCALGLPFSLKTTARPADRVAGLTGVRTSAPGVCRAPRRGRHGAEPAAAHRHQPGPRIRGQKGAVEAARAGPRPGGAFYYADGFNISRHPTLRALWSPVGRRVVVPTPARPTRRYGLGAVERHVAEAVVITRRRKRRREVAELPEVPLARHPRGTVHVARDDASTHEDEEVEAVPRGAAGRLVLPCRPTGSPWLNPVEMLWRRHRREVTRCELFEGVDALLDASRGFSIA